MAAVDIAMASSTIVKPADRLVQLLFVIPEFVTLSLRFLSTGGGTAGTGHLRKGKKAARTRSTLKVLYYSDIEC